MAIKEGAWLGIEDCRLQIVENSGNLVAIQKDEPGIPGPRGNERKNIICNLPFWKYLQSAILEISAICNLQSAICNPEGPQSKKSLATPLDRVFLLSLR